MSFLNLYLPAFLLIMTMMTGIRIISIFLCNVSIVDLVWGAVFVLAGWYYLAVAGDGLAARQWLVVTLVTIWGLRLALYLTWRNWRKGEDFRYQAFRQRTRPERYSWFSFFQTFLLQGTLAWLISAPLLGAQFTTQSDSLTALDGIAVLVWLIGFIFEAGGDWQLARFKQDPANKGKFLTTGFWRFARHPNYSGDAAVWWAFGLFSLAAGSWLPILGSVIMTVLLVRVSGLSLLEKSLVQTKPGHEDYVRLTSSFIPWFPNKEYGVGIRWANV